MISRGEDQVTTEAGLEQCSQEPRRAAGSLGRDGEERVAPWSSPSDILPGTQ